jgi:hypothetical protein
MVNYSSHGSQEANRFRRKSGFQYSSQGHARNDLTSFYSAPPCKFLPSHSTTADWGSSLKHTGLWGTFKIKTVTLHEYKTSGLNCCSTEYQIRTQMLVHATQTISTTFKF